MEGTVGGAGCSSGGAPIALPSHARSPANAARPRTAPAPTTTAWSLMATQGATPGPPMGTPGPRPRSWAVMVGLRPRRVLWCASSPIRTATSTRCEEGGMGARGGWDGGGRWALPPPSRRHRPRSLPGLLPLAHPSLVGRNAGQPAPRRRHPHLRLGRHLHRRMAPGSTGRTRYGRAGARRDVRWRVARRQSPRASVGPFGRAG